MTKYEDDSLFKLRILLLETIVIFVVVVIVGFVHEKMKTSKEYNKKNPYIIASTEDFVDFANMVCDGYSFKDEYVLMTEDIDLTDVWVPAMGARDSGHYFEGIFDGGGHVINNIRYGVDEGDNALFGTLAGTVMNLGIESGVIQGDCCGSIASHSLDENARIINCYNKAYLYGDYVGGIAGNFDGKIINCFSMCDMYAEHGHGNIICYGSTDIVKCFSAYKNKRGDTHNNAKYSRFFIDEEKYTAYSQFMPIICDELNDSTYILSIECPDIPVESYNAWELSVDKERLYFSVNKMSSSKWDKAVRFVLYIFKEYYPFSAIGVVIFIFINVILLTSNTDRMKL